MEISAVNNNDLFKKAVLAIRETGEESASGNSQVNQDGTRFIDGVFVATVANPRDRWLSVQGRKSSAVAAICETLWVLAGRNDLKLLSRVLPRAPDFSDDGMTWRAAYGPRLYSHSQIDSVINRLRNNPNTRQAYLTIYDPALDSDKGLMFSAPIGEAKTKDMVCNFALAFSIKNGKLDITVFNRSQDVLWGMSSINFIEFSIIQEIIARVLQVDVGVYRLVSNNLHYYNNEVSQSQLSLVTDSTAVISSSSERILFSNVDNQWDIQRLFAGIVAACEAGNIWDEVVEQMNRFDANGGLIRDMAMIMWSRLNNTAFSLSYIKDDGLRSALMNSPIDRKWLKDE